jgi:uncharacterized membrane protein YgdD (TMEM256/DUF423 family)
MHKPYLIIAAILGALAVAIGAFGAHGVKNIVSADVLEIYETGVKYQFYHVFALLAVGILYAWFPGKLLSLSGLFFIIGIVLFSGSLYLITALKAADKVITPAVGIITPIGGLFFIAGWILLFIGLIAQKGSLR